MVVVDEEAIVPKYPKHLRRLKSQFKQPLMQRGTKLVRLRKSVVEMRMIWWMAYAKMSKWPNYDGVKWW